MTPSLPNKEASSPKTKDFMKNMCALLLKKDTNDRIIVREILYQRDPNYV